MISRWLYPHHLIVAHGLAIACTPFASYLPTRLHQLTTSLEGAENHAADAAPLRRARWRPPRGERGTEAVAGP